MHIFGSSVLLLLCALTTFAEAQLNLTDILAKTPSCAISCSITALSTTSPACGLAAIDTTCLCNNGTLSLQIIECVQKTCTVPEMMQTITANQDICPNANIPNRGWSAVWVGVGLGIVTFLMVLLRFYSRIKVAARIWWDDWSILIAFMIYIGIIVIDLVGTPMGSGRHVWQLQVEYLIPLQKMFVSAQVFYLAVLALTRVSILLFYLRVFTRPFFLKVVRITIAVILLTVTIFIFLTIFRCRPVRGVWNQLLDSKCLDAQGLAYSVAGIGIVQDIWVLLLPVPELKELQMNWKKKINMIAMFSIGAWACVTSIIRLNFLVTFGHSKDPTWDNITPSNWSLIEINIAMICACLPAARVLIVYWIPALNMDTTVQSSSKGMHSSKGSKSFPSNSMSAKRKDEDFDEEEGSELQDRPYSKIFDPVKHQATRTSSLYNHPRTGSQDELVIVDTSHGANRLVVPVILKQHH